LVEAMEPTVDDAHRRVVIERIERSPVRRTLSKPLFFATADGDM
jgi:hypothetical protein